VLHRKYALKLRGGAAVTQAIATMPCWHLGTALESRVRLAALNSTAVSCNRTEPANARAPLTWKMSRTRHGQLGHPQQRPGTSDSARAACSNAQHDVWLRVCLATVDLTFVDHFCPLVPQLSLSQTVVSCRAQHAAQRSDEVILMLYPSFVSSSSDQ
jgi:hypothetical protein